MKNITFTFRNALISALVLSALISTACSKGSVTDSAPQQPNQSAAQPAAAPQQAAAPAETQTQPNQSAQPQQATPSPTLHPIMKQAQAQPGVPVPVPDAVRRPLNAEEMKKALEAMPPEVRARIQGMQAAPQGVKPQATPKK